MGCEKGSIRYVTRVDSVEFRIAKFDVVNFDAARFNIVKVGIFNFDVVRFNIVNFREP